MWRLKPLDSRQVPLRGTIAKFSPAANLNRKLRLHSLDALRTLAALAVVLAHWPEHFFSVPAYGEPISQAPFFRWLNMGYLDGAAAVTFFFCLSGFIFYWLYADAVHSDTIGFGRFAILRFSRLYPLHLIMLLLLVPLVLMFRKLFGFDFVYQHSDAYHFGLNLAFLQYWGLQAGYSWDGPSWSISVEIALYILFFIACRFFAPCALQAIVSMVIALGLAHFSIIASAAVAFFSGGVTYYGFTITQRHRSISVAILAIVGTIFIWAIFAPLTNAKTVAGLTDFIRHAVPSDWGNNIAVRALQIFTGRIRELLLFPSLIFTSAVLESATPGAKWRALSGVGNISYGVYLIHFPLQLIAVTLALALSMPKDVFTWPSVFLGFFGILIFAAVASYRWLERPAMLSVRQLGGDAVSGRPVDGNVAASE